MNRTARLARICYRKVKIDMYNYPEASVVRIFTANGVVVGTGFLAAKDTVLTCAHIIAAALKLDRDTLNTPTEAVLLDFPLVAPANYFPAHVLSWTHLQPNIRMFKSDVADVAC